MPGDLVESATGGSYGSSHCYPHELIRLHSPKTEALPCIYCIYVMFFRAEILSLWLPISAGFVFRFDIILLESQDAGLLESILMPFDIYNDSAQHALHVLKQRFLYDEIEAEGISLQSIMCFFILVSEEIKIHAVALGYNPGVFIRQSGLTRFRLQKIKVWIDFNLGPNFSPEHAKLNYQDECTNLKSKPNYCVLATFLRLLRQKKSSFLSLLKAKPCLAVFLPSKVVTRLNELVEAGRILLEIAKLLLASFLHLVSTSKLRRSC
eukprot:Gb_18365 [translate_table: standard]